MRDLAIYGAGGLGRETAVMIEQINKVQPQWNLIGFFDDGMTEGDHVDSFPVLGGMHQLNEHNASFSLVIAIADSKSRKKIYDQIKNIHIDFPVLIHPQAIIGSRSNNFHKGAIIAAGCIFTTGISVGEFAIVNLACTVGHDVKIGNYCSVMPGCNISGNVEIGEATLIGTGSQVLQNITIGKHCKVGAGAVVTADVEEDSTVVGVPAKRLV